MNLPVRSEASFDIVAIAASAGGVTALTQLLGRLPAQLGAIIVIVQHLDPRHRSLMPQVIGRQSRLPVMHAEEGLKLLADHIYLAPPNQHMLINRKGTLTLTDTELVNFVRPSADLMFESVAAAYGDRAIAVVLTGSGHDGAMGVTAIKQRGGTVIAQDEASSEFFGMPSAAIATGAVDFVLPLDEIAPGLMALLAGAAVD
ncbi:MAG: chemotaxis protein CheB [Chloroflexi bacterium]|nr:MAG: chemotaxis protein CheB [Chloroflexota bacterium]TMG68088.1 MAG: chemotaxis protein CheB [Chloroflexota bacterium]